MPACTVLLFYRNHFSDLYCHVFIVTLGFVTQVKGTVLRILYTHVYHHGRAAWGTRLST